jgi:hypothetical protein
MAKGAREDRRQRRWLARSTVTAMRLSGRVGGLENPIERLIVGKWWSRGESNP